MRELRHSELDLHVAAVCDALCVFQGFRCIGKETAHLLLALDIKLAAGVPHAVLVGKLFARLHTQEDVMGFRVLCKGIVAVISGDQGNTQLPAHAQQFRIDGLLVRIAMVLQLQEKIAFAKDLQIALCRFAGPLRILPQDLTRDLARQTGGGGDDALVELTQQVQVHTGLVIEALCERPADDLHQVGVAGIVFRQQDQMIIPVVPMARLPVMARAGGDIDLASDDRIDALFFCRLIKIDHAVHDAVIGYCSRRHSELLHPSDVLRDFIGTVQKGILRVDVKMCKRHRHLSETDRRGQTHRQKRRTARVSYFTY